MTLRIATCDPQIPPEGRQHVRVDMKAGELREWLLNIMYYLLENGPVLQHGQTIGMTAEQKIRIQHCPSLFGHPGKVIRLVP